MLLVDVGRTASAQCVGAVTRHRRRWPVFGQRRLWSIVLATTATSTTTADADMSKTLVALQDRLQTASTEFQKIQSDMASAVDARQRLEAQQSENELVKKVCRLAHTCIDGT